MRKLAFTAGLLFAASLAAAAQTQVRYHFGDDPDGKLGWARPDFDDGAWPILKDGEFLTPPEQSDGYFWVRTRIPAPAVFDGPAALEVLGGVNGPSVETLFFNGAAIRTYGTFPPHALPRLPVRSLLLSLPSRSIQPGGLNAVALRGWVLPGQPGLGSFEYTASTFAVRIGSEDSLEADTRADRATALLARTPDFLMEILLVLLGAAMVLLWRLSPSPELLLCALWLIVSPMYTASGLLLDGGFFPVSLYAAFPVYLLVQAGGMYINVELTRAVLHLRSRAFRIGAHAFWILYNLGALVAAVVTHPAQLAELAAYGEMGGLALFNCLMLAANLRAFFTARRSRSFAAANGLINVTVLVSGLAQINIAFDIGPFRVNVWSIVFYLSSLAIAFVVIARVIGALRSGYELRAEFDAAREVQERLVAPAADIPGFKIQSAYQPAKDVGGDFFFVRTGNNGAYQDNRDLTGGAFVVVGDVSGKGLRAALTVSAIMGALRTMPDIEPARVLAALNRGLIGQLGGGFVTCCAITISADGTAIIANAGHLQPYCNGKEIALDNGLPLGIATAANYAESTVKLAATDRLTLLTDGVLEARNPSTGELFGFDRTAAISTQSAQNIALAAQAFGQDDDITVLTITSGSGDLAEAYA